MMMSTSDGAFIPGIVLASLYASYVLLVTIVRPEWAPPLPLEARSLRGMKLVLRCLITLVPPLVLIFLVLGTIFLGIATPTEGGAMGATGAIVLALIKKKLTWSLMRQAMDSTAKLSSFVLFILVGSSVFGLTFRAVNGDLWVEHLLIGLPGGQTGFLIVVNVMVFLLAFFLDFFELAFIVVPLLGPAAEKLGIDLIWFGVLLGVNMQTSFMHPPFGFALFYLRSVAPVKEYVDVVTKKIMQPITTMQIYWGAVPFVVIQCIMVALVIAFPQMVTMMLDRGTGVDPNSIEIILESESEPTEAEQDAERANEADTDVEIEGEAEPEAEAEEAPKSN